MSPAHGGSQRGEERRGRVPGSWARQARGQAAQGILCLSPPRPHRVHNSVGGLLEDNTKSQRGRRPFSSGRCGECQGARPVIPSIAVRTCSGERLADPAVVEGPAIDERPPDAGRPKDARSSGPIPSEQRAIKAAPEADTAIRVRGWRKVISKPSQLTPLQSRAGLLATVFTPLTPGPEGPLPHSAPSAVSSAPPLLMIALLIMALRRPSSYRPVRSPP